MIFGSGGSHKYKWSHEWKWGQYVLLTARPGDSQIWPITVASLSKQAKEKRNCPGNLSYEEICPFYQGHIHTRTGGNCILKQLGRDSVAIGIIKMCA